MGCDIHLHIEVKVNNKWEHFAFPSCGRNYTIFGKLAGVRIPQEDSFKIKGLPDDLSVITKIDAEQWIVDMHNPSYITGNEIIEFSDWIRKEKPLRNKKDGHDFLYNDLEYAYLHTYFFGNSFAGFWKYPEDFKNLPIQDIRFVFWFDN